MATECKKCSYLLSNTPRYLIQCTHCKLIDKTKHIENKLRLAEEILITNKNFNVTDAFYAAQVIIDDMVVELIKERDKE